jgi:hypothetical protein
MPASRASRYQIAGIARVNPNPFTAWISDKLQPAILQEAAKRIQWASQRCAGGRLDGLDGGGGNGGEFGRADPARSAHFPAEWRRGWVVKEKTKISLRRKKAKGADQAGSALSGRR